MFLFVFAELVEEFQILNLYDTRKSTTFGLIVEVMYESRIVLTALTYVVHTLCSMQQLKIQSETFSV